MKLRTRTIWAVALCTAASFAIAQAGQPPKPATPAVELPQDSQHIQVSTPLGGPAVTLPVREGIPTSPGTGMPVAVAPKVSLPAGAETWPVHGPEGGPVVSR